MTVTALPAAAEAPDRDTPRRLFMQAWFATQARTCRINPDDPANAEHRTWLELTAADVLDQMTEKFEEEMEAAYRQAARRDQLPLDGFLHDSDARYRAIWAALSAGCAEILAGEVVQS